MTAEKKTAKVVDLYAGVGGLSLGAAKGGFQVQAAFELDQQAANTHALNFPNARHVQCDVGRLTGQQLLAESGLQRGELAGLIGGPPCQGFSEIGHRAAKDPRNVLFVDFFRLVSEVEPAFFLAENVPGVLARRNSALIARAHGHLPRRYTVLEPFTVTASEYGAPTSRTRIFFYGYDRDRVGKLQEPDFRPKDAPDIRVRDALAGLPAVRSTWQSEGESWRVVGTLREFDFTERISKPIPRGIGNPTAIRRYRTKRLVSGFLGTVHRPETVRRFASLGPGEIDPVSKCKRLDREGYCPTLRAGTGPERGSYQSIRPVHPSSPRVIAPREAARLQGFPDWFQFHPTKWHAFRQIGNSVSPIVAEFLLTKIFQALK